MKIPDFMIFKNEFSIFGIKFDEIVSRDGLLFSIFLFLFDFSSDSLTPDITFQWRRNTGYSLNSSSNLSAVKFLHVDKPKNYIGV